MKSVLIEEEIHKKLKEASKKSGIKIKSIVESGILYYINQMKFKENKDG